jgi:hypothetical protein
VKQEENEQKRTGAEQKKENGHGDKCPKETGDLW